MSESKDDPTTWSSERRKAYQRGVDDGEARARRAIDYARERLTACIELVAKWERIAESDAGLPNGALYAAQARQLREAIGLPDDMQLRQVES